MDTREFMDAMRFGHSLPLSNFRDPVRFKPLMTRAEWEQLGRWRRLFDRIFGGRPPEDRAPSWLYDDDECRDSASRR